MARLAIRFGAECDRWGEARVLVEVINERHGVIQRSLMALDISRPTEIDIEGGSCLVRATLPTGELISETVEVNGKEAVEVRLTPGATAPRDLSWAYYLMGLDRCGTAVSAGRRPALLTVQYWAPPGREQAVAHSQIRPFGTGQWRVGLPENKDGLWLVVQLDERPIKAVKVPPDAWEAVVVFDHSAVSDKSNVNVVMPFGSPSCMALMGYLHRGLTKPSVHLARAILGDLAEGRFRPSRMDAAVLACYFARAPRDQVRDYYRPLARVFGDTADWHVLEGWLGISSPNGPADLRAVTDHFVAATESDQPYLTEAMRLLVQGLDFMRQCWSERRNENQLQRVNAARDRVIVYAEMQDWSAILHSIEMPHLPWWVTSQLSRTEAVRSYEAP